MAKLIVLIFSIVFLEAQAGNFIPSSFTANFKKTVASAVRASTSKGKLAYQYPGKIKFVTESTTVVSNGNKFWYYRPPNVKTEKGNLKITSSSRIKASGMFDALNSKNSKEFKKVKKGDNLTYILNKKAINKYGIRKLEFIDKSKKFTSISKCQKMIVHMINKKIETYELSDFKNKVKFKSSEFQFAAPENTDIQER
jgi:outer membrane lipoprotein-sorting protein